MLWLLRALVIVYLLLPIAAIAVGISMIQRITNTLTPVYDAAGEAINDAADALEDEFSDLRENFQPLADALNRIRSALSTIRTFVNNQVNRVIDFVNTFPGVNIGAFNGFDLPDVISFNFLNNVSGHVRTITREIRDSVGATREFFADQAASVGLIGLLLLGWFLVSHLLGAVVIVRSLWK